MIYKRAAARLRAQDWVAITIELSIVVVGVFIGTQVANWNEDRLTRRETQRMLVRLKPEIDNLLLFYTSARDYYRTTRGWADTAFAAWRGDPAVSDRDFVIAAYQASQIYGSGTNISTWATIFGADRLRTIDNDRLRTNLAYLMSIDTSQLDISAVDTPYRRNVRRIVPVEIQDAIRAQCGDRSPPGNPGILSLPSTCDIEVAPAVAAAAAADLRAHPELVEDLRWHTASAAYFLENVVANEVVVRQVQQALSGAR